MKIFSKLSILVLCMSIFASCNKSVTELANSIEKTLLIKVNLNTTDSDGCMKKQLQSLLEDYSALDREQKEEALRRLSDFNEITLNRSIRSLSKTTKESFLALKECDKSIARDYFQISPSENYCPVTSIRNLSRNVSTSGTSENINTKIETVGRTLSITNYVSEEITDKTYNYIENEGAYEAILSAEMLEEYKKNNPGIIQTKDYEYTKFTCGTKVTLLELLNL